MSKISHRIRSVASILFVGYAALFASGYAFGVTQNGVTVGMVGTTGGAVKGVKGVSVVISPNPSGCLSDRINFLDSEEEDAPAVNRALSVAMVAKLTVKTVSVNFNQPGGAGTQCLGTAIFLE